MRFSNISVFVTALVLVGCGGGFDSADEYINNAPSAVGASDEDLGEPGLLMGSYRASEGTLLGLVLSKQDGKRIFVADQQVWCFKAPCFPEHLKGTWTARDGKLFLTENANKHIYEYTLDAGTLTLFDPESHKRVGAMDEVRTWCGRSSDCELQQVSQPMISNAGVICQADQTCAATSSGAAGLGDACQADADCAADLSCQDGVCF